MLYPQDLHTCRQPAKEDNTMTVHLPLNPTPLEAFPQRSLQTQDVVNPNLFVATVIIESTTLLSRNNPVRCVSLCPAHDVLPVSQIARNSFPNLRILQDDMLRKAGMHSWESDRGVWQVGGGKRRRLTGAGLKAPKRQLKPVERTRRAGEEGLYLTSGREGVRQQQDNDTTVEEGGIVSSKTTPPSVEPANAKGNSLPQKIVNDTNSKLVGNMISKVAIKIQQADGSVFVFRKKGSKSHAGLLLC